MKKFLIPVLALVLVLGLCSCFTTLPAKDNRPVYNIPEEIESAPEESESTPEESGVDIAAVTAADLEPQLEAFRSVYLESFMAEFDYDNGVYTRLYNSEEDAYSAEAAPAALVPSSELEGHTYGEPYNGYVVDPADAACLEVKNFASIADMKENLSKYLDESFYEALVDIDFFEFDGKVYAVRGGRGYGTVTCGEITAIQPAEDGSLEVTAERLYFDEPDGAFILTLREVDGALKIIFADEAEAVG